jgi:hypothetical protein
MSNYPPGVTGNEPQITGEWPCAACGGHDSSGCWLCGGSGIEPEDAPCCPTCGSDRTDWIEDLSPWRLAVVAEAHGIRLRTTASGAVVPLFDGEAIICRACKEVTK